MARTTEHNNIINDVRLSLVNIFVQKMVSVPFVFKEFRRQR